MPSKIPVKKETNGPDSTVLICECLLGTVCM